MTEHKNTLCSLSKKTLIDTLRCQITVCPINPVQGSPAMDFPLYILIGAGLATLYASVADYLERRGR